LKTERPYILVTNDDGINSPGILALVEAMEKIGDVAVVAPERQQSAMSSALTLHYPLKVKSHNHNNQFFGYSVDGTPSDCVKMAVNSLLKRKPDLVVSGINHGQNTSINVLYSGTVSGAIEGIIAGIPSIAFSSSSHDHGTNLDSCKYYAEMITRRFIEIENRDNLLLNVNIPDMDKESLRGVKVCRLSDSRWADRYEKRNDPFGNTYYWFAGSFIIEGDDEETDDVAIQKGFVTLTPLKISFTDFDSIGKLKDFEQIV
jgi:5'-nucleotidase